MTEEDGTRGTHDVFKEHGVRDPWHLPIIGAISLRGLWVILGVGRSSLVMGAPGLGAVRGRSHRRPAPGRSSRWGGHSKGGWSCSQGW